MSVSPVHIDQIVQWQEHVLWRWLRGSAILALGDDVNVLMKQVSVKSYTVLLQDHTESLSSSSSSSSIAASPSSSSSPSSRSSGFLADVLSFSASPFLVSSSDSSGP